MSGLGLGALWLAAGATRVGPLSLALGLAALLPLGMLRLGASTDAATRALFAVGLLLVAPAAWATGGSRAALWSPFIALPSLIVLVVDRRRVSPLVWLAAAIPLIVLAGEVLGWAPPPLVLGADTDAGADPVALTLVVLGIGLAFAVARFFEVHHRRAATALLSAQRGMVELLRRLDGAGADLREAAAALSARPDGADGADGGSGGESPPAEGRAERSLVEAMRVESERGRGLVSHAVATVEEFVHSQERISSGFAALSERLAEVEEVAGTLDRLANKLESMALGFQIEAAAVGAAGTRFAAVGRGMAALAAAVTADAQQIHATLARIAASTATAGERAVAGALAADRALERLEALSAYFERICALVGQAATVGDEVVSATLSHLDLLGTELRQAAESQETTTADEAKGHSIAQNLPTLIGLASGTALAAAGTLAALGLRGLPSFLAALGVLAALPLVLPWLRGRARLGAHVFLFATGTLVIGGAALSGGLRSPVAPGLVLLPLAAVFFFDQRAGLAWTVGATAAAAALFAASQRGLLPGLSVSPRVARALHGSLETVFVLIAFGYSRWLARLLATHAERLAASDRRVRGALAHVEQGSEALAQATAGLTGSAGQAAPLVDQLEREAAGAEARAADTRGAFHALTTRNAGVERAGEEAHARAEALDELLERVGEISSELDLIAIQTAIEAVQVGEVVVGFQVLSREATRLAGDVQADVRDMQRGLQLARDAVRDARDGALKAASQTRQAAEAVEGLTRAFDSVYALAEQGAHAGRALAARSGRHLETLRRGLRQTSAGTAGQSGEVLQAPGTAWERG